jgi:CRP-like cAMP-binding protein
MAVDFTEFVKVGRGEGLSDEIVTRLAKAWISHVLQSGEVLWRQGEPSASIGLLHKGELQVIVDGQDIGTVRPGQIFGEASAFHAEAKRSATLQAVFPSEVLLLDRSHLSWLRRDAPLFYDHLLTLSLEAMARRVRTTDKVIANLSPGSARLPSYGISTARSLWRAVRKATKHDRPELLPLLRSLPRLQDASQAQLTELAGAFGAQPFERGQVLVTEGEEGNTGFLVASGAIKATRSVQGQLAEELVRFERGDLLGIVSLVSPGARSASCIGKSPGWVYEMSHRAYRNLQPRTRILWKECIATHLAIQLRIANQLVSRSLVGQAGGPLDGPELERVVAEAGGLTEPKHGQ